MPICCICERNRQEGHTIELSDQEKQSIQKMGQIPLNEYFYCRACYRLLSNPESMAQLVKGVVQVRLNANGDTNSEKIAKKYYEFFLKNIKRKS